jgi:hypothetical protein
MDLSPYDSGQPEINEWLTNKCKTGDLRTVSLASVYKTYTGSETWSFRFELLRKRELNTYIS